MKKLNKILFVFFLFNLYANFLCAQYTFFKPKESFAIEVSLPNTELKRIPIYRNSISSLIVNKDQIIGGTSAEKGLAPFIFVASLKLHQMMEIKDVNDVIKGQQAIKSGFCRGSDNFFYAGTLANKKADGSNGDGHLIQLEIEPDNVIHIKDLGIPVKGEGIFSMVSGAEGNSLYGVTYPSGVFFKYNIETKEVKTYKDIAVTKEDIDTLNEYDLRPEDYLSKSLIQSQGLIFGSTPINRIFYFDPKNETFHIISNIPEVWGRRTLGRVESWALSSDGKIYGGNSGDGQLFEINPISKKLRNLGKPIGMNQLSGLCFGKDNKLYGIAGGKPGYSHLFSYDDKEGFTDFGNPEFTMIAPGIEQGILWRGFQLRTITSSQDGKYIVMGEDESLSQLLIFAIEDKYVQRIGM